MALEADMLRDLRVALFSGNYNCVRDGANNALNHLGRYLLDRGAAVRVYSPTVDRPAFRPAGDLVSVPSVAIPGRPEYRLALGLPHHVREDIRAFAPTVFHLSAPDPLGLLALSFGHGLGVPVVASLHTRFETYFQYYHFGILEHAAERYLAHFYKGCDMVLAPSEAMIDALRQWGVANVGLWSRGVDHQLFSPARRSVEWRREQGYADEDTIILFFGRLVVEKGLHSFAEAIAHARRAGLPVRPLVIGAGPAEEMFRSLLGDAVFTGHIEGPDLGKAVASADILLNPSTTEAFGNVNLEAMASGLAVVSADVPAARTLIADGETGLLVDPDQADGYGAALTRLLRAPALRAALGSAAAAEAFHHDWDSALQRVEAAYRAVGAAGAAATPR